jgi:CRISPR system Cascade subunit CasD
MAEFLVFGLTANLGSMGELAGHERRGSLSWPARSAIVGLMAAALGIRRDGDFSRFDPLAISVAIFDEGASMRDFHTAQTVPKAATKNANSRPEALRTAAKVNTVLSLRDYRLTPFHGVAVTGGGLHDIAAALDAPAFHLYLGRKSCPLAAPAGPRIVDADSAEEALRHLIAPPWRVAPVARTLVEDSAFGHMVHDRVIDREKWHFGSRRVHLRSVEIVLGEMA